MYAPKLTTQKKIALVLATVFCVFIFSVAHAAINPEINYQGKLLNTSGTTVTNGSYNIEFKLYTQSSGGSALWTEDDLVSNSQGVNIASGLFSLMLGSTTPFTGVNFNQTLYLGVNIGGTTTSPVWDGEMTPRKILGAVPAAFVAQTLNGFNSSEFLRSDAANSTSTASTFFSITQSSTGDIADFIGQNSVPALYVQSTGNVGIGTTSPYATLSVQGSSVLGNSALAGYFVGTTTATSTFAGGISANIFNATSATASSTFADGINLTSGCFAFQGSCLSSGSGAVTGGTAGQTAFYLSSTNTVSGTSTLYFANSSRVGISTTSPNAQLTVESLGVGTPTFSLVPTPSQTADIFDIYNTSGVLTDALTAGNKLGLGTTTPNWNFQIAGNNPVLALTDTSAQANEQHWYLESQDGNFYIGTSSNALSATSSYLTFDNRTNNDNTGIGYTALGLDTTGSDNVALGYQSGSAVTTATDETFIGYQAGILTTNSTAQQNTFVGYQAGFENTTGKENTLLGSAAIGAATGNFNTIVGASAGFGFNTSGSNSNNVIIGYNAVGSAASASTGNDTIVGYQAATELNSSANDTIFGYQAGYNLATGAGNNLFLGYQTASTTTSGSNNIALGYNVDLPKTNGNNQLDIANLLYGANITGSLTTSAGTLGVGTSSPYAELSVTSLNAATTTLALVPASSQTADIFDVYNTSGNLASVITSSGSFGIGSSSPSALGTLDVAGGIYYTATSTGANGLNLTNGCFAMSGNCVGVPGGSTGQLEYNNNGVFAGTSSPYANTFSAVSTTGTSTFAGSVSIGTTSSWTTGLSLAGSEYIKQSLLTIATSTTLNSQSNFLNAECGWVKVYAGVAYVSCDNNSSIGSSFNAIDVSVPSNPTLINQIHDTTNINGAEGFDVEGQYAYVTGFAGNSLAAINISNPGAMKLVSSLIDGTNLDGAEDVQVSGDYAYVVAYSGNNLTSVNVSNPASMVVKQNLSLTSCTNPTQGYIIGSYDYIGCGSSNFIDVVKINANGTMALVNSFTNSNFDHPGGIAIKFPYMYIADQASASLITVNISNPTSPVFVSVTTQPFSGWVNKVAGNYLYTTNEGTGALMLYDISSSTNPTLIQTLSGGGLTSADDIWVQGKYVYVTTDNTANNAGNLTILNNGSLDVPSIATGVINAQYADFYQDVTANRFSAAASIAAGSGGIFSQGEIDAPFFTAASSTVSSLFAGGIGIGTTSPYATLSVQGSSVLGNSALAGYFVGTTTATSTFAGGISANIFNATSATASSTFADGINLTSGCFAVNGTCISSGVGGGGGSGTVNSGTAGEAVFYGAGGTTVSGTSSLFFAQNSNIGIGTTSPYATLSVASVAGATTPAFLVSTSTSAFATSTAFEIDQNGNIFGGLNGTKVGFGTTTPTAFFAIQGLPGLQQIFDVASSSGSSVFHITYNGNVGIATTSPGTIFSVAGVANFSTGTSTLYSGVNLSNGGCYAVSGTCINGGTLIGIQSFTSSGSWSKPAGVSSIEVVVTGGGSGGSAGTSATVTAGGGGAGGTCINYENVSATSSVQVLVGAAGTAASGASATGGTGGTSSFGPAYCTANGGVAGAGGAEGPGGSGGTASTGAINITGGDGVGGSAALTTARISNGGGSYWGGGGATADTGNAYGSGGAGGTSAAGNPKAGAGGIVVVYEYGNSNAATNSVGGISGQLQYNNAGLLGGASNLFVNNSSGNFGVGSSTPFSVLSVQSVLTATTTPLFAIASSTNSTIFSVLGGGNVGINIPSPSATFQVKETGTSDVQDWYTSNGTLQDWVDLNGVFNSPGGISTTGGIASNNYIPASGLNTGLDLQANRFDNAGTAIILSGGTSPSFDNTSGQSIGVDVAMVYNQPSGTGANTDFLVNRTETSIGSGTQRLMDLQVGSVSKFNVSDKGQTGIGTSTPYSFLSIEPVAQTAATSSIFSVASTTNLTLFNILATGNVGLGTTTPATTLDVNGNVTDEKLTNCTGSVQTNSAGQLTCSVSDERVKQGITPLTDASGLDIINQLNPVTFEYKDPSLAQGTQYGFLAQDVQTLLPGLVASTSVITPWTPNGTLDLNYQGLIAPLVKAVQELSAQVTALQGQATSTDADDDVLAGIGALGASQLPTQASILQALQTGYLTLQKLTVTEIAGVAASFDHVTTNTIKVNSGIEMVDQITGLSYCVNISNGNFIKTVGSCQDSTASTTTPTSSTQSGGSDQTTTSTSTSSTPSSSTSTSTSTDPTIPSTATTTPVTQPVTGPATSTPPQPVEAPPAPDVPDTGSDTLSSGTPSPSDSSTQSTTSSTSGSGTGETTTNTTVTTSGSDTDTTSNTASTNSTLPAPASPTTVSTPPTTSSGSADPASSSN